MSREFGEFTVDALGEGDDLLGATARMLPVLQNWLDKNYSKHQEERELISNRLIWECLLDDSCLDLGKNSATIIGFSCN